MGWLNFGGKKRKQAQGFGNSKPAKSRKRPKTFILEKIVTPSAGVGGWLQDFDSLHQLWGAFSLPDLDLPNFLADSGVCPIDPFGAPTNNLPPLIDFDPLGLYHDGIATQTPYHPGGAFETLPITVIPVDPQSPNANDPNAIRQLLDFPFVSQPLVASIDTGVSADSPYLNYANIKNGRDYVGGDDNPLLKPGEGSEHGTFMLGIIDAINKTAPKWVGRAIDSGRWADSLVEFVDAAKASGQKNAIANLSLDLTQKNADGSVTTRYELTPAERSAIEYARQNGVMLVVAAGNDGGVMSVLGQASQEFDNIFTVGAGDINGRSIYSSYGRGLDILADGGTSEHPGLSTVGNDLGTMAGTSVATAKVAGAASLVWAANPALNYRQVMEILKSTARDLGTPGWDDETGFGFLNTLAAVDLAKKTMPTLHNPPAIPISTTWAGEGKVTSAERSVALRILSHVEGLGDREFQDDQFAGTRGESRRLEGFQINLNPPIPGVSIKYMAHVQESGDTPWVNEGRFIGTRGQSKRTEGFAIQLTGPNASNYIVAYRGHIESIGDTAIHWDGEYCGTKGESKRLEGFQVWLHDRRPPYGNYDNDLGAFKKEIILGKNVKFEYENGYVERFDNGYVTPKIFYGKPATAAIKIQISFPNRDFSIYEKNQILKAAENWEKIITKDKDSSGIIRISVVKQNLGSYLFADAIIDPEINARKNFSDSDVDINGEDYDNNIRFNSQRFSAVVNNNSLVRLAMHEIGHTLGLDHENGFSLMNHSNFYAQMTKTMYDQLVSKGYGVNRNAIVNWY